MVTATTQIYTYRHTLALHDALPIFLVGMRGRGDAARFARDVQPGNQPAEPELVHRGIAAGALEGRVVVIAGVEFGCADRQVLRIAEEDRKSTRLNSSH